MATAASEKADLLLADLRRIFGQRLQSLVTYGEAGEGEPLRCLAVVTALDATDLDACARAAHAWHRDGLATPLILPVQELQRSLDAFPLEYSEIQRAHTPVFGSDPFAGLRIDPSDLRRACEAQVKSHLLYLREEYIEAEGRAQGIAEIVQLAAPAFAALLRSVARLHGATAADRAAATREGARIAGLPEDTVSAVLALEHPSGLASTDPARLFPQYLAAVEQLAAYVDRWRME